MDSLCSLEANMPAIRAATDKDAEIISVNAKPSGYIFGELAETAGLPAKHDGCDLFGGTDRGHA
jgi:hypothetical protein